MPPLSRRTPLLPALLAAILLLALPCAAVAAHPEPVDMAGLVVHGGYAVTRNGRVLEA